MGGRSNFYVEKWPPGNYSIGPFFYNLHGEKWPQGHEFLWSQGHKFYGKGSHFSLYNIDRGVTFLRRKMTPGSLFYGVIFLQPTRRKFTPRPWILRKRESLFSVEYWPGVTFLRRKVTPGSIFYGSHFSPVLQMRLYKPRSRVAVDVAR
jgi:hypothetical protein